MGEVIVWESAIGPWCLRDKSVSLGAERLLLRPH